MHTEKPSPHYANPHDTANLLCHPSPYRFTKPAFILLLFVWLIFSLPKGFVPHMFSSASRPLQSPCAATPSGRSVVSRMTRTVFQRAGLSWDATWVRQDHIALSFRNYENQSPPMIIRSFFRQNLASHPLILILQWWTTHIFSQTPSKNPGWPTGNMPRARFSKTLSDEGQSTWWA